MACNACESSFNGAMPIVVTIGQSGANATVGVSNQGRNIVMIRRILLCYSASNITGILYLRPPPDAISWIYPSAFLEPGTSALYYQLAIPSGYIVQAQAEYIEITSRSRSCSRTF